MSELLPCPFCGGEAELTGFGAPEVWVWCPNCKASTDAHTCKAEAIEAWNTRYHSTFEETVIKAWQEIKEYQERTCKPVEKDGVMRCSECDYPLGIMSVPAFCAGCGAKMVEQ